MTSIWPPAGRVGDPATTINWSPEHPNLLVTKHQISVQAPYGVGIGPAFHAGRFGLMPGGGFLQLDVVVPSHTAGSAMHVSVTLGGNPAQSGVTIATKP